MVMMKKKKKKMSGEAGIVMPVIKEVVQVSLNDIELWKDNPRNNDASVKPLSELLQKHGQMSPLVVDQKSGIIYKGNTTYKAMKKLGWKKAWVAYVRFPSYEDAVAYALADNKSSEWSDWNERILANLIPTTFKGEALKDIGKITGFKENELHSFFVARSNELPDELAEVDIKGMSMDEKADYLVLQFNSHDEMVEFRDRFDNKKNPRMITFEALLKVMKFRVSSSSSSSVSKKKVMKKKRRQHG